MWSSSNQTRDTAQGKLCHVKQIVELAPHCFSPPKVRVFLRLLILMKPYSYLEDVATHFAIW